MERRKCCTRITQDHCTDIGYKCRTACCIWERYTMITRVGFWNPRIFAGCLPVKLSTVNDHASNRCSMTADKFRCGVNHQICTMFDRPDQIRCCKCRIYYQRNIVSVRDLCHLLQIDQIWIRISKCLYKYRFCIFLNGCLKRSFFLRVHKRCCHIVCERKSMRQKIVCAAVDGLGCHNMLSRLCKCLKCIGNCCRTGCYSQRCHTAF